MEWKYKINEKKKLCKILDCQGRVWVFLKWIIASIRLLWCLDFIRYMLKSGVTILVLNDMYINKAWHSLQLSVWTKWN